MKNRTLPPLNALRAFEAAARHLSFARAADELVESLVGRRRIRAVRRVLADRQHRHPAERCGKRGAGSDADADTCLSTVAPAEAVILGIVAATDASLARPADADAVNAPSVAAVSAVAAPDTPQVAR